jgi:homoserine dehydrogenase
MKRALIVGKGLIGKELQKQLEGIGVTSTFFTSKNPRHTFSEKAQQADVVFIAISTKDRGQIALAYIIEAIALKRPVVTCEKGALAYNFQALRDSLPKIGFNAAIGGGCGMLDMLRGKTDKVVLLHAVLNGTLNHLFSTHDPTIGIEASLANAQTLGLCEPGGGSNITRVVKRELTDILWKMTLLTNVLLIDAHTAPITPESFTYSHIDDYDIPALLASGKRFVVSILKKRIRPPQPGISALIDGLVIHGGFVHQKEIPFFPFPYGAGNLLRCEFSNNTMEMIGGIGAGATPTARRMIEDAKILIKNR